MGQPRRRRKWPPGKMATSEELFDQFVAWMEERCPITCHLHIDAEPRPESLRVYQSRVYQGKLYAAFHRACVAQLAEYELKPQDGPMMVAVEAVCTRPKTTKRSWPVGDVDNYLKGPMDALTRVGAWHDDDQVQIAYPTKRYAKPGEEPGVNIVIGRLK